MKTTITYTSLNTQVPWPALLAQQLDRWHSLTTITAAEVVLEQQRDDRRAFRVKVRLAVPGPGLRTEASDSTLEGALLMATLDLEHQIQARSTQSRGRGKSTPPPSAIPRRGAGRNMPGQIRPKAVSPQTDENAKGPWNHEKEQSEPAGH